MRAAAVGAALVRSALAAPHGGARRYAALPVAARAADTSQAMGTPIAMIPASDAARAPSGPWNPGIVSQLPVELRHLCTVFRPENIFADLSAVTELQLLTGLPAVQLVAFRPQRLILHELLIRITADFSVPDGSRIEDLGINFRGITSLIMKRYLEPQLPAITSAFARTRSTLAQAIHAAFATCGPASAEAVAQRPRWSRRFAPRHGEPPDGPRRLSWGLPHIAACESVASSTGDALQAAAHRSLAQVWSALFATHGGAWGTPELIEGIATDLACNTYGSEALGQWLDPILREAAAREGYPLLPRQERPVVINTKGASASGKSSLRPLQKRLAGNIGVRWSDFALISPDIWRKQLLDYASLGAAHKYAGAFTADELQIIDHKLDGYMARKHERGDMPHLLIDRFRFDSFAPHSDEAGSNLLTRFGHAVYLFFMITPPEQLVERAWKRGLEVGRYKAVDDTLAHSVEAYAGLPDLFFTWVRRADKRIQFEFLDNSVQFGELPRVVAFGTNDAFNLLDVNGMLDIERFKRVNVEARSAATLYPDHRLLAPEYNAGFLKRCIETFREVNCADQASGRIYLRTASGTPVLVDREALQTAAAHAGVHAALKSVIPRAFDASVPIAAHPLYLGAVAHGPATTLGQWGTALSR